MHVLDITMYYVASLVAGIEALYATDMARLGANARRKACADFDWDRIMPQLMERYAALLASPRRAAPEADGSCRGAWRWRRRRAWGRLAWFG